MRDPDVLPYLAHVLESIEAIERYTRGMEAAAFLNDSQAQDAVVRRLEIIGEAVKNVGPEFRAAHTEIPWKRIAGLRDVLIHRYFEVDLELTWETVQEQLPTFKQQVQALLQQLG